jgi:hypothetical protein
MPIRGDHSSRFVGYPEVGQKRGSRRSERDRHPTALHFLQRDFWLAIVSGCTVIRTKDYPLGDVIPE